MKRIVAFLFPILLISGFVNIGFAQQPHDAENHEIAPISDENDEHTADFNSSDGHAEHEVQGHAQGDHHSGEPSAWWVIPFVLILLLIATGPLFFEHFWHHNYPKIAIGLGVLVAGYYLYGLGDKDTVIHTLAEYVQFIALLTGLFVASGGIMIKVDKKSKPMTNVILLIIGSILANIIGTTGASMLLIRPFIRLNKGRVKPYHIVFFIFMVSNVGGALTPIGDPPLFLGFLKGVPFTWTISHNIVPWAFAILMLAIVFLFIDGKDAKNSPEEKDGEKYTGKISITGGINFVWIALVIGAVFLDPNVFEWVPSIKMELHGQLTKISFVRELLMFSIASLSYYFAQEEALKGNEFEFEPIKEVAFLFIGIFFTMMPALQLVGNFAKSPEGEKMITTNSLYWGTGTLSGVLDNAPTYVNFLTASVAANGGEMEMADVGIFAEPGKLEKELEKPVHKEYKGLAEKDVLGDPGKSQFPSVLRKISENKTSYDQLGNKSWFETHTAVVQLLAISIASVFFGAMTYIGNAPNFMVKSIAEQTGIKMPSFFGYITRYSLIILLPILFLVWLIFFYFKGIDLFI